VTPRYRAGVVVVVAVVVARRGVCSWLSYCWLAGWLAGWLADRGWGWNGGS